MEGDDGAAALAGSHTRSGWQAIAQATLIAAQVACGLFVGYWAGISPLWNSLWWTPASLIAVAGLALTAAVGRRLRVFFLTAAIFGGFTIAYSVAIVVVLGGFG